MDENNHSAPDSATSPLDEGELEECDFTQKKSMTEAGNPVRAKKTLEDTEAQLRKKLLEKHQQKDVLRVRRVSDEEEMFAMQPGFQESKKKEVSLKTQREKMRDDEARERQLAKERERALRKPIEWPKEKDRKSTSSKRTSREAHSSDQLSPPLSQSHGYQRNSPLKRKPVDYKEDSKRSEKSSRREIEPPRESSRRHHHHHHKHYPENSSKASAEDTTIIKSGSPNERSTTTKTVSTTISKRVVVESDRVRSTVSEVKESTRDVVRRSTKESSSNVERPSFIDESLATERGLKMKVNVTSTDEKTKLGPTSASNSEKIKTIESEIRMSADDKARTRRNPTTSIDEKERKDRSNKSSPKNSEKERLSDKKSANSDTTKRDSKENDFKKRQDPDKEGQISENKSVTTVKKQMIKSSSTSNLPIAYEEKSRLEDIANSSSASPSSSSSSSSESTSGSSSQALTPKTTQDDKTTHGSSTKSRLAKVSSASDDASPNSSSKLELKEPRRKRAIKTPPEKGQSSSKKPKSTDVVETSTSSVSIFHQIDVEPCSDVSAPNSPLDMKRKFEAEKSSMNSAEGGDNDYKKYSRFESSPEMDDFSDDDEEFVDRDLNQPAEQMSNEDDTLNLSELERKNFEDLTEEDKGRLTPETLKRIEDNYQRKLTSMLPVYYPGISGCRNVAEFENLNRIEEGTFGVVFRAVEKKTDEVVALKRLKMENEHAGFPITSLREINMLLKCGEHPNIVKLREIVVGSNIDRIYLVMEYVDHDMKALMETMSKKSKKFTTGQVKTLLRQLLSGVKHLHEEYVIHRDLKTSNLLLTRNGILKIGDFGLAREFGDPLKPYTPVVVTLWYRSPELLLGVKEYSTAIDMWSVGCIFGEFLKFKPLFPGKGEVDQIKKIFTEIGTPTEKIWPGYSELPSVKKFALVESPFNQLKKKFVTELNTDNGFELFNRLLAPCPFRRISAEKALQSEWFTEDPLPTDPSLFPTWPSKSDNLCKDKTKIEPPIANISAPPVNASRLKLLEDLKLDAKHANSDGFSLKFDVNKF